MDTLKAPNKRHNFKVIPEDSIMSKMFSIRAYLVLFDTVLSINMLLKLSGRDHKQYSDDTSIHSL